MTDDELPELNQRTVPMRLRDINLPSLISTIKTGLDFVNEKKLTISVLWFLSGEKLTCSLHSSDFFGKCGWVCLGFSFRRVKV